MNEPVSREPPSIAEWRVKDLIALIGSDQVAPGAGSAGAVALGLAAACASKAVSISLKHHPGEIGLQGALECFHEVGRRALSGADQDAEAFANFIRVRNAAAAGRLVFAGETLAHLISAFCAIIDDVEPKIHASVAGDVAAARALAGAARSIQAANEAEAQQEQNRRSQVSAAAKSR
jgi:formiminotransferase-cyclodeaminase